MGKQSDRQRDLRDLRDKASNCVNKGRYAKALDAYLELEAIEPADGDWSRKVADMYRRLDRDDEAVLAWERAADRYATAGFLVKAVALCKLILQQDRSHTTTLERLAALQAERGIPTARGAAIRVTAPAAQTSRLDAALDKAIELEVAIDLAESAGGKPADSIAIDLEDNAPLETVILGNILPDAEPQLIGDGQPSGIVVIPLDDDDLELIEDPELVIEESTPEEDAEAARAQAAMRLERTPLFSSLGPVGMRTMIDRMELIELDAGAALFREGDAGNTLYVIVDGAVAVIREGPPRVQLSTLGEGEFFGEVALVTDQPRNATIEAIADTTLLAIDRDVIREVVRAEPGVIKVLLRFLRDRLLDNLVATSPLFQPFQGDDRASLAARFRFIEADTHAVLIRQGERAEGLYVMLSGRAGVVLERDGQTRPLALLRSGDIFGEMSLLGNSDAVATVSTTTKCFMLQMPAEQFRTTIMTHPQVLMFVGELADQRQKSFDAAVAAMGASGSSGETSAPLANLAEGHLDLI